MHVRTCDVGSQTGKRVLLAAPFTVAQETMSNASVLKSRGGMDAEALNPKP